MGYQDTRVVAEVTLSGVESDEFLVDSLNLSAFERGGRFTYFGGHYKSSPVILRVPSAGTWSAVVVPTSERVQASVRTLAA
jgi:hypothetical protein